MDESEDVIDKIGLLELEENGNMFYVIFFIFLHFVKKNKNCCPLTLSKLKC